MKIRDTEGQITYSRRKIYEELGIVGLQGLLMDSEWNPTAGIEAIDYEGGEAVEPLRDLGKKQVEAKKCLTDACGVPLYIITSVNKKDWKNLRFDIYEVKKASHLELKREKLAPEELVEFWTQLKGTNQKKELAEASVRIQDSNVDTIIEASGSSWGGNIDGILLGKSREKLSGIIEVRKTNKKTLDEYDPDNYFHYKGGDYNTWKPLHRLSKNLDIPLILMTFKPGKEKTGMARVENIDQQEGVSYGGKPPYKNVMSVTEAVHNLKDIRT